MRMDLTVVGAQRTGRTGRHREGRVLYILAAGAEENKYRRGLSVRAFNLSCCNTVAQSKCVYMNVISMCS